MLPRLGLAGGHSIEFPGEGHPYISGASTQSVDSSDSDSSAHECSGYFSNLLLPSNEFSGDEKGCTKFQMQCLVWTHFLTKRVLVPGTLHIVQTQIQGIFFMVDGRLIIGFLLIFK